MSAYDAHQNMIAPARASASLPRLSVGLVILFIAVIAFNLGLFQILQSIEAWDRLEYELITGNTARAMLVTLFSFIMPAAALWVVVRLVHDRSFTSLLGPIQPAFRDFFRVFRIVLLLVAVILVLPSPAGQQPLMHLGFPAWLPLVLPALLGLFIQVTTEELIFRGYLQSQLAARFASPLVWMVLPSIFFGFLHFSPEVYGENAMLIALWATAFGIAAADLTARSGSLGPAIAMHFVNNIVAIMIVAMQHHWDGLALLHVPYGPQDVDLVRAALILEGPILLCLWLGARIAIRR
ncbi:CPBP family intramembrane glutamic endopeptidase [Cognatishimia activa]|uniref:CPBP family intramembrane glutamic endopeptidase n=1 Tax=Cognatishimia activa TaxID=1715691 RepID=UPI002231D517|nr:CPBP family intramembrane glutamic endopeptidase [Cognatishimia activa]UZD90528.1 CPBP family intramembrane metalloprotease [Cognatishimia activa]